MVSGQILGVNLALSIEKLLCEKHWISLFSHCFNGFNFRSFCFMLTELMWIDDLSS
jgi:hypothetical protein